MRKTVFLTGVLCLAGVSSSFAARSTVPQVPKDILYDFTYSTAKGYGVWADAILPYLEKDARR